jgi:hypothetical protein
MGKATYNISGERNTWRIEHDGAGEGSYSTKESAFEAAVAAASNSIKDGHEIVITVPGRQPGQSTLGST